MHSAENIRTAISRSLHRCLTWLLTPKNDVTMCPHSFLSSYQSYCHTSEKHPHKTMLPESVLARCTVLLLPEQCSSVRFFVLIRPDLFFPHLVAKDLSVIFSKLHNQQCLLSWHSTIFTESFWNDGLPLKQFLLFLYRLMPQFCCMTDATKICDIFCITTTIKATVILLTLNT